MDHHWFGSSQQDLEPGLVCKVHAQDLISIFTWKNKCRLNLKIMLKSLHISTDPFNCLGQGNQAVFITSLGITCTPHVCNWQWIIRVIEGFQSFSLSAGAKFNAVFSSHSALSFVISTERSCYYKIY